jgi:hypothetical protein
MLDASPPDQSSVALLLEEALYGDRRPRLF